MKTKILYITLTLAIMFIFNISYAQDSSKRSPKKSLMDPPEINITHVFLLNRSSTRIEYALSKDKNKWTVKSLGKNHTYDFFVMDSIYIKIRSKIKDTIETLYPSNKYEFLFNRRREMWFIEKIY